MAFRPHLFQHVTDEGYSMTLPRDRFDYSAIVDRQPLKLPNDARIVVWTIVNVEDWDIRGPMPRTVLPAPGGASVIPDVPNWAWYEYGMRVGFWRLKEALDRHRIKATMAINAAAYAWKTGLQRPME